MSIAAEYLRDVTARFHQYKTMADQAIAQVADDDLFAMLDSESNSIAILMRHLGGNMRSRWTHFLTSDGEKPDRNRDQEFADPPVHARAELQADWESGWKQLFAEIATIAEADLLKATTARHESMTALSAINRQLGHAAQHVGQIVMLAKHYGRGHWRTLTIARGKSEAYNEEMRRKHQR